MDVCGKKRLLMIMTSSCAGAAFGLLCIAVATDYWLYTSERVVDSSYNTSAIYKRTYSGLWRKCEHTGEYLPASHSSYCCYICLCFYSFYYYITMIRPLSLLFFTLPPTNSNSIFFFFFDFLFVCPLNNFYLAF